jgi:uncharacterized protein YegL
MVTPVKKAKKTKKPTNTRIFFVIDRSGSMQSIKTETIGGFNAFVEEQKKIPEKATFSMIQFDHQYDVVHDQIDIQAVPLMTDENFQPRGMTALYDAVGMTIGSNMKAKKNEKTLMVILTDGQENASKEFSYEKVQDLIKEAQTDHNWEVMFIGANMNATQVATGLGISAKNSVTFDYDAMGATNALSTMSYAISSKQARLYNRYFSNLWFCC